MGWKEYPYWKKGALIFLFIEIVLLCLTYTDVIPFSDKGIDYYLGGIFMGLPIITLFLIVFKIVSYFSPTLADSLAQEFWQQNHSLGYTVISILYLLVLWFAVGALLGYIYSKIRSKPQTPKSK